MTHPAGRSRPLVVLASRAAQDLRELETALYAAGFQVVTARTEHDTVEKVRAHHPDAVLLDRDLGTSGYALCRSLRDDPAVSPAAPIIVSQDSAPTRAERMDSLRAGAWDVGGYPPDSDELLLRLRVFLDGKLEVDRLSAESLIDRGSGLYNAQGFAQRTEELAALGNRQGSPAACAVFRPTHALPSPSAADRLGRAFKAAGRRSDAIGRTAEAEFAVFAPATHEVGAARLVHRIRETVTREVGRAVEPGKRVGLRAAYSAALPSRKVEPKALLERARAALGV